MRTKKTQRLPSLARDGDNDYNSFVYCFLVLTLRALSITWRSA